MTHRKTILFIMALLLLSCSKGDGDIRSFRFFQNSTITINESGFTAIRGGENLVFEYFFTAEDDPQIADDEYSESIVFEVPSNVESFSFSNEELIDANTFFDEFCFCFTESSILIENGTISGTKINDSIWLIEIDVAFINFSEQTRNLSNRFQLSSR